MPTPGGAADKFGNRYEGRWTVLGMLRILQEQVRSIHLEPVGPEGEGVEFYLTDDDGGREYHQVKRQRSAGSWTIAALAGERVLATFRDKFMSSSSARCRFVSMTSADDLRELAERARSARDFAEFESRFLAAHALRAAFDRLRNEWGGISEEQAHEWLQRTWAVSMSEDELIQYIEDLVRPLVDGDPASVRIDLAELALNSIHKQLDAIAIWDFLHERGHERRVWANDPHLLQQIEAVNARYLDPIRREAILESSIPRDEAEQILNKLEADNGKRAVLVTGDAGTGKTGVLAQVIETARSRGWLTMAFRMDRLDPVVTVRQLGDQLDLPESPVDVLAGAAGNRRCLLVIDQLDAVSQISGRNPAFFERVEDLIRQSERWPNMRLVLSCRKFDLDNDSRLRRLIGERGVADEVSVGRLSEATVRGAVERCGLAPDRLSAEQLSLLALPYHLKLLAEILEARQDPASFEFRSLEDLHVAFEQSKRRAIDERLGGPAPWAELLDTALDRMMNDQSLWIPAGPLESEYGRAVSAFVSEGVMVVEGTGARRRIAFFHETFFDYQFAQSFMRRGFRLGAFVRTHGQHLFLRSVVRQILTYMRAAADWNYLPDLRELLSSPDIRFHLKSLVIAWLRALPDPTRDEWELVRGCLTVPDETVAMHIWRVVWSPAWFDLLDRVGYIHAELDADEPERVERMLYYLELRVRDCPDRVAEIALSLVKRGDHWPEDAWRILCYTDLSASHRCVELYLALLDLGVAPINRNPLSMRRGTSSQPFPGNYKLASKQPAWALEVFEAWLVKFIRHHERLGELDPFNSSAGERRLGASHEHVLESLARSLPEQFVVAMLPVVLELARRNARRDGPPPWEDSTWGSRLFGTPYSLHEELFQALETALAQLPGSALEPHLATLHQYVEFKTAGRLLARCYTAHGQAFADRAVEFLLSDHAWMALGWYGSPHWVARELIAAVAPHCSNEPYQQLEGHILTYYPERERWHSAGWGQLGLGQLALLHGLASDRQTAAVRRRLGELQRKFDRLDEDPPRGITGGFVGPPVNAQWDKLTDRHWLRLIKKYNEDRERFSMRGGPWELARILGDQAKKEPERFARLFLHPEFKGAHSAYQYHVLSGLAQSPEKIDATLVWDVLRRAHEVTGRPLARAIESLVCAYLHEEIPDDILAIVAWYATKADDPQAERWTSIDQIEEAGMNSDRGSMAWAVAKILFANYAYIDQLSPALEQMVRDPSPSVRTQVAHALLPILNHDRGEAVKLFLTLCDTGEDGVLASEFVYRFLHHASRSHFFDVEPVITRMLSSQHVKVAEQGARLICIAAVRGELEAIPRAYECLNGPTHMRQAAATIAAANVSWEPGRAWCERALIRLFNDEEQDVRSEASTCFHHLEETGVLKNYRDLIAAYLDSRSFPERAYHFFDALKNNSDELPEIVCEAFEHIARRWRDARSRQERPSWDIPHRGDRILLQVYGRATAPELRQRCLDIIDELILHGGFDLDLSLAERS